MSDIKYTNNTANVMRNYAFIGTTMGIVSGFAYLGLLSKDKGGKRLYSNDKLAIALAIGLAGMFAGAYYGRRRVSEIG
jgi:allophanate hydrolase subunit 1